MLTLSAEQGWKDAQFQLSSIHQKWEIVSFGNLLVQTKDDNKNEKQCAEAKEHIKLLLSKVHEVCTSCKKKKG